MSLQVLEATLKSLPYSLADQVNGYARSVQDAAPEIFRDAGVRRTPELTDQLVYFAGLRKLYSIVDANYWVIENAGSLLSRSTQQPSIRVGSTDFSRGGEYHLRLRELRTDLSAMIQEMQMGDLILAVPLSDVVKALADGR